MTVADSRTEAFSAGTVPSLPEFDVDLASPESNQLLRKRTNAQKKDVVPLSLTDDGQELTPDTKIRIAEERRTDIIIDMSSLVGKLSKYDFLVRAKEEMLKKLGYTPEEVNEYRKQYAQDFFAFHIPFTDEKIDYEEAYERGLDANGNFRFILEEETLKQLKERLLRLRETPHNWDKSVDAINQAGLPNCFLVSTILSTCAMPGGKEKLQKMITDHGDGSYTVTFPGDPSNPIKVTKGEEDQFIETDAENAWAQIIVKAFAMHQVREKYRLSASLAPEAPAFDPEAVTREELLAELNGDDGVSGVLRMLEAQTLIHGKYPDVHGLRPNIYAVGAAALTPYAKNVLMDEGAVDKLLAEAFAKNKPVAVSTGPGDNSYDLQRRHVYAVVDYDPFRGTVTIKNPRAGGTEPLQDGLARDGKGDGIFKLSLREFREAFLFMLIGSQSERPKTPPLYVDAPMPGAVPRRT